MILWIDYRYDIFDYRYMVNWIEGAFNRLTYELVILDVKSTDFGQYTCRVKNDKGTGTAKVTLQSKLCCCYGCSVVALLLYIVVVSPVVNLWFLVAAMLFFMLVLFPVVRCCFPLFAVASRCLLILRGPVFVLITWFQSFILHTEEVEKRLNVIIILL